tara:strand:- start:1257 stop:1445 length:189 start_codon:yes stop_codon:yes gene_type:complete
MGYHLFQRCPKEWRFLIASTSPASLSVGDCKSPLLGAAYLAEMDEWELAKVVFERKMKNVVT